MASRSIRTLELNVSSLPERLQREVERGGIKNCVKILQADETDIKRTAHLRDEDVDLLKQLAAATVLPKRFITAAETFDEYKKRWRTVSLDCLKLDKLLGGGIPTRGITELYGISGSGKTQIALQLSITVQYPECYGGLDSGCVYICTEARFPSQRMQQMVPHFPRGNKFDSRVLNNAADQVFVDHIPDIESLNECLKTRLPVLLMNRKIGLIVIDSIAALFRADYTNRQMIQRAQDLRLVGSLLHHLATKHNMAVLCINQVSDAMDSHEVLPALGLAWANIASTRLQTRTLPNQKRSLSVMTSPHLPSGTAFYHIVSKGVEDV